jgi:Mor family transcriptional regulator
MNAEIIEDYKAGMLLKDIAAKYYVSPCYVYKHLKGYRRGKCIKHREEIRDRYLQGETIESLVKRYKVSRASVRHILKGYNIKIRKVRKVE